MFFGPEVSVGGSKNFLAAGGSAALARRDKARRGGDNANYGDRVEPCQGFKDFGGVVLERAEKDN